MGTLTRTEICRLMTLQARKPKFEGQTSDKDLVYYLCGGRQTGSGQEGDGEAEGDKLILLQDSGIGSFLRAEPGEQGWNTARWGNNALRMPGRIFSQLHGEVN